MEHKIDSYISSILDSVTGTKTDAVLKAVENRGTVAVPELHQMITEIFL